MPESLPVTSLVPALRLDEQRLLSVLDACESGVAVIDGERRVVLWNAWMARHSRVPTEEACGRPLQTVFPDVASGRVARALGQALDEGMSALLSPRMSSSPLPLYAETGEDDDPPLQQLIAVKPLAVWGGRRLCVLHVFDVTASVSRERALRDQALSLQTLTIELGESERRIRHLAHHDSLTGLPNRALFHDRLQQAVAHARREQNMFALLFIDLNRFKTVNDSLGHDAGDALLCTVAARVSDCVRDSDTVARLGGDEFAVIQTELRDADGAAVLASKLVESLVEPVRLGDQNVFPGASIGISIYPHDETDPVSLLKNADLAMYKAKEQHGTAYCFFSAELQDAAQSRMGLEHDLRTAIREQQLELYYQPQFSAAGNALSGVEALARWRHPQRGAIGPDEFIPVAERSGLIVELGEWVLTQACAQRAAWTRELSGDVRIAVNLSVVQLKDADLAQKVQRALTTAGLPGHLLELEITETVLMNDVARTVPVINALRDLGVSIAIDDFGAGYSSLQYLRRFAAEKVKIDRSFVLGLDCDGDDAVIVDAIIGLGHSLGHTVIAEGVENETHLNYLRARGCDALQGFLLGRPAPANEFLRAVLAGRVAQPASV